MKTFQDTIALLQQLNIPDITFTQVNEFDGSTSLFAYFANGTKVIDPGRISYISVETKGEGLSKYVSITGKNKANLNMDFMYHYLDNFQSISSYEAIRERIKNPALCGSFATTIAVNKYIDSHAGMSETEIKAMLSGSKWRWVKTMGGEYQQTTLYEDYSPDYVWNRMMNSEAHFSTKRLSSIKSLQVRLRHYAENYVAEQVRIATERATTLAGYNTRATEYFLFKVGKDARYRTFLGVELELENHSAAAFSTLNLLKNHAIFKRDGSLTNGVEICTAPATLDVHKEAFKPFFEAFQTNKCKLLAANTCGMHVHIDRAKLSSLHIANLCLLLNNEANNDPIVAIAGRPANKYCNTTKHSYRDFTNDNRGDRYKRVNLTPDKTIELRLFASTINYKDFAKRLEFTQAVVDYTRPGETNITCKEIPVWENFKGYVLKHKGHYPILAKEI